MELLLRHSDYYLSLYQIMIKEIYHNHEISHEHDLLSYEQNLICGDYQKIL